jgi:GntR family transcriptional repressor for pyruvate dehydrogenase complex
MDSKLLKIKFQSRAELVVDKIINSIINGELSDGELLPPENKLCQIFGVSRSILRESIRVLVSKGLIEVKQGHGTFVRQPQIDVPEEAVRNYMMVHRYALEQLMEVRMPIEVEMSRLAAKRRREEHIEAMQASLLDMQEYSKSAEVLSDADDAFHRAILEGSGNSLFGIMIRSIMGNLHIGRQLAIRHFGIEVVIQEHEAIYTAIKNKQPALAAEQMKAHMDGALLRIEKVNKLLAKHE